jgi:diaminobutyrate-2-oxoglutarate transaminase
LALVLMRRELDLWSPGEHNGTFRGNNPAFVTAKVALEHYWTGAGLTAATLAKGERIARALADLAASRGGIGSRGRGLVHGLAFADASEAAKVSRAAFERGLLVETSGGSDEVVKLMPPLTVTEDELDHGLNLLVDAVDAVRL